MVVTVKSMVFRFVTPCSSEAARHFRGTYRLHLQSLRISQARNQQKQVASLCCAAACYCTSLVFTSFSPSHMQTCVKILKFTGSSISKLFFKSLWCTTCFERYGHHQVLRKLLLKTAAVLRSLNITPNSCIRHAWVITQHCRRISQGRIRRADFGIV
jgi:hypothetical protein